MPSTVMTSTFMIRCQQTRRQNPLAIACMDLPSRTSQCCHSLRSTAKEDNITTGCGLRPYERVSRPCCRERASRIEKEGQVTSSNSSSGNGGQWSGKRRTGEVGDVYANRSVPYESCRAMSGSIEGCKGEGIQNREECGSLRVDGEYYIERVRRRGRSENGDTDGRSQ